MPACPAETYLYTVQSGDSLWLIAQRHHTTVQEIASVNPGLDFNPLYIGQTLCVPRGPGRMSAQPAPAGVGSAERSLGNRMRLLWEQHVYWTRMFLLSTVFGLPDAEFVTSRLLRNPKDFEALLKPFYGEDIASKFAELFTNHLTIAAELVKAAKAGDASAAADAEKRWYANADRISAFLGGVNPYWPAQEWQKLLYDHLAMTKAEAADILTQKYAESIDMFDAIEREALAMADNMTQGIAKQFAQYFR